MKRGIIRADRGYLRKEAVDDRVFSAFVEHAGNVIYNGIYQPEHPLANADGFREDLPRQDPTAHGLALPGDEHIPDPPLAIRQNIHHDKCRDKWHPRIQRQSHLHMRSRSGQAGGEVICHKIHHQNAEQRQHGITGDKTSFVFFQFCHVS